MTLEVAHEAIHSYLITRKFKRCLEFLDMDGLEIWHREDDILFFVTDKNDFIHLAATNCYHSFITFLAPQNCELEDVISGCGAVIKEMERNNNENKIA